MRPLPTIWPRTKKETRLTALTWQCLMDGMRSRRSGGFREPLPRYEAVQLQRKLKFVNSRQLKHPLRKQQGLQSGG